MNQSQQIEIGTAALSVDGVLCDAQLVRLGVTPDLFPGLPVSIRPNLRSKYGERLVTFRALDEQGLNRFVLHDFRRMAGTAELRSMLGIPEGQWHVRPRIVKGRTVEAVYMVDEPVLVLFESGNLSDREVTERTETAKKVGHVVLGTACRARADRLGQKFSDVKAEVL